MNLHHVLVNFKLEEMKSYVEKMEEFLRDEISNFDKRFEEETSGWSNEDKNEYGEFLSDDYWTLAETHPNLLRSSMFITIYSFAENELKSLCQIYRMQNPDKRDFFTKGQRSSKINRYLTCIEQYTGVDIISKIEKWELLDNHYREVRNILAHDGGEVDDNKEDINYLLSLLEELKVKVNHTGLLILPDQLCLDFLNDLDSFFNSLFRIIEK